MPIDDVAAILNALPAENGENLIALVNNHPKSSTIKVAIRNMNEIQLMTGERGRHYLKALLRAVNVIALTQAYKTLYNNGLPMDGIEKHKKPVPYADATVTAYNAGILLMHPLGKICYDAINRHPFPVMISQGLILLHRLGKLTEPRINDLTQRKAGNSVVEAMQHLNDQGLLAGDDADFYLNKIINEFKFPYEFVCILTILKKSNLWNDDYYDLFHGHLKDSLRKIKESLAYLENRKLLTTPLGSRYLAELIGSQQSLGTMHTILYNMRFIQEIPVDQLVYYHTYVLDHPNGLDVSATIKILSQLELFTDANLRAVISHERVKSIISILTAFYDYKLCKSDNSALIFDHILQLDSDGFASLQHGLMQLYTNGLLREPSVKFNFHIILSWKKTEDIATIIQILKKYNALNNEIFQSLIVNDQGAAQLSVFFETFDEFDLLTTNNIQRLIEQLKTNPLKIAKMNRLCWLLDKTSFFTGEDGPTNLELFLEYKHFLLQSSIFKNGLKQVPVQLRTPDVLTHMIALATTHQENLETAKRAILVFLNQLRPEPVEIFHEDQTTHTASVNESASLSASSLATHYNPLVFSIPFIYKRAKQWLAAEPHSIKKVSAQDCLERLFKTKLGLFEEPTSEVQVIQLFCYIWLAIHDDSTRIMGCEVTDARNKLLDGLYEIERGGNLDADGVDSGESPNQSICYAGSFNKLVETMVGVHPSVKIDFVTRGVAAFKLPRLVNTVTLSFLLHLSEKDDQLSQDNFEKWTNDIQPMQGIPEDLWKLIEPEITKKMFDEFGKLYPGGIDSSEFKDMIGTGEYVSIDNGIIDELKEHLKHFRQIKALRMEEEASRMVEDPPPPSSNSTCHRFRLFNSDRGKEHQGEPAGQIRCTEGDPPSSSSNSTGHRLEFFTNFRNQNDQGEPPGQLRCTEGQPLI